MTNTVRNLFVIAGLLTALAIAGLFYWYNVGQQEIEAQAITSMEQGIALYHEKKYAESLKLLQGIPNGVIEDWHLPYYTASAQVMLKDYQSAALKLEEALVLNPREIQTLFELGVVYYKLGKLGLSKGYFASVVEIDPTHEEAKGLMDIMANLERQKNYNGADGN
jgi:tetratricopeptide (TPR) repeat protein